MLEKHQENSENATVGINKRSREIMGVWVIIMGGNGGCTYEHVSIQIIEQVELGNYAMLAKRELYCQNELRCFV